MLNCFSHIQLSASPWTVTCQDPLSIGFSRQEYWSVLLCLPPGDIFNPGISQNIKNKSLYLGVKNKTTQEYTSI